MATFLGHLDPGRSIRQNVDPEDRISLEKLIGKGGESPSPPLVSNFQGSTLYLNESGLYSSIFGYKLEFRVSYKGGSKMDPPFGSFKNEWNETDPLNES